MRGGLGVPPDGQSSLDAAAGPPAGAAASPSCMRAPGARRPPTARKELLVGWLVLRLVHRTRAINSSLYAIIGASPYAGIKASIN